MDRDKIKSVVREKYGQIVTQKSSCCGSSSCYGSQPSAADISKRIGYTDLEIGAVPEGANLGLGCGNPVAIASLREGETVLDLGSGAGFDCFLAAKQVGKSGKVIGVDMTSEMIEKARNNARFAHFDNVEFRLGEIEHLPVADKSVDVIISNCVVNLAPDKRQVFDEAFRVLKHGGRLMISDIVLLRELPALIRESILSYVGCVAGAVLREDYLSMIQSSGFSKIEVVDEVRYPMEYPVEELNIASIISEMNISPEELKEIANSVVSIKVKGVKE